MYVFRNKKGKEIIFSQEEIGVYEFYIKDIYNIKIPSNEEADEGYYLVEYNGYKLKE